MSPTLKTKIVLVTNIPSPYRTPIFDLIGAKQPAFTAIYCKRLEADREWNIPELGHNGIFLDSTTISLNGRFIHLGLNIVPKLIRLNPDIIITTQYYPACLLALLYAKLFGRKHICMYDGWEGFDKRLTPMHRWLRAFFYHFSDAFIGVSSHTRKLFEAYKVNTEKRYFWSPLCIDNQRFSATPMTTKQYDILLSGRIVDIKLPEFTVQVLAKVFKRRPAMRVLIIGSGDKLPWLKTALKEKGLPFDCPGFIQQENLPKYYRQARILLMPTTGDCWGLVANEAMALGIPVITTPEAGVKDDLVRHEINGFVLEPDVENWASHILSLLESQPLYESFSQNALDAVQPYTFLRAEQGITAAINYCKTLN